MSSCECGQSLTLALREFRLFANEKKIFQLETTEWGGWLPRSPGSQMPCMWTGSGDDVLPVIFQLTVGSNLTDFLVRECCESF